MSDYSRQHDFGAKDDLTTGDPNKVIKGSEVDSEFDALVTAVATKVDEPAAPSTGDVIEWTGSAWGAAPRNFTSRNGAIAMASNLWVRNGATAATQGRVTADELLVFTTAGSSLLLSSVDETATITASGVNGLDTGSEAGTTFYDLYVIYNGSSTDALLVSDGLTPVMPGGYTHKAYVGSFFNDETPDFLEMQQRGSLAFHEPQGIFGGLTSLTYQTATIVDAMPTSALTAILNVEGHHSNATLDIEVHITPDENMTLLAMVFKGFGQGTGNIVISGQCEIPVTKTTIAAKVDNGVGGTATAAIDIIGWRFT